MGFCFFNNLAIATRVALDELGLKRVAIVDFDVHHGNGTQAAFEADPRVLFCSLHQYPLYPMSGLVEEIGVGLGRGYTVNVPLPAGCGDLVYQAAFEQIVEPAVRRFQPELIAVSAGFDAHWADPLATMCVSTSGFVAMTRSLVQLAEELCEGRLAFTLEGGYDLDALSASVAAVVAVLAGDEPRDPLGAPPQGQITHVGPLLDRVRQIHGL